MERREFDRVMISLETRYRRAGQSSSQIRLAWSQDIGGGGIRLLVKEALAIGQEVRCTLRSQSQESWWPEISGIVAWQGDAVDFPDGLGQVRTTGICFSPSSNRLINARISELLGKKIDRTLEAGLAGLERLENTRSINSAYDASTITYRVARAFGWGPLNNLGYYQFPSPLSALNLLWASILGKTLFLFPEAQERLVKESVKLLDIQKGDKVLDIACGRGKSSFIIASLHPYSRVVGIDLLAENIWVASTLYNTCNLEFLSGDATNLEFASGSFNRILCLEAAFHFPDRSKFLKDAYKVLKEDGRLVIVDFMWKTDRDRVIRDDEQTQFVRDIWQFNDFSTMDEYIDTAINAGFVIETIHGWDRRVTAPFEFVFKSVATFGRTPWGRRFLVSLNPLLKGMTEADWEDLYLSALAHDYVRKHTGYTALVLTKLGKK